MRFPRLRSLLENRPAEVQGVLLISALAILRIIMAVVIDLTNPVIRVKEVITDFSILLVFVALFVAANRNVSFKRVHPLFGILIVLLLGVNFLQFGGVNGTNCFNYYSGIYVTVMLFSRRMLYGVIGFQLALLALLLYLVFINHPFYHQLFITETKGSTEFIFSLIAIAVFTFYLKRITVYEIAENTSKIEELRVRVRESKQLNSQFADKAKELTVAQHALNAEVDRRVKALETRKDAIEQYIHHNTTTLKGPLNELSAAISQIRGDTQFHALLKVSHSELNQVVANINQALSEERLTRSLFERKK